MSYGPNNDLELFEDTPGTSEENPILIYSYEQLRNVCKKSIKYWKIDESNANGGYESSYNGGWLKLMKDINCNDECQDGWQGIELYHNFNLNGFSILAPVIKKNSYMFKFSAQNLIMKNGYILNLFENGDSGSLCLFDYTTRAGSGEIVNVMIDCYFRHHVIFNNLLVNFKYCTFRIGGKMIGQSGLFGTELIDCRVIFNDLFFNKGTMAFARQLTRCRIEGTVKGDFSLGTRYQITSNAATRAYDCVISIDAIGCSNEFGIVTDNCLFKDNYTDYLDLSKASMYNYTFYALSEDDMKDPDKVTETGFFVVKV